MFPFGFCIENRENSNRIPPSAGVLDRISLAIRVKMVNNESYHLSRPSVVYTIATDWVTCGGLNGCLDWLGLDPMLS